MVKLIEIPYSHVKKLGFVVVSSRDINNARKVRYRLAKRDSKITVDDQVLMSPPYGVQFFIKKTGRKKKIVARWF